MTTLQAMLRELTAAYPSLTLEIVEKAKTAYLDDDRYAAQMIGVIVDDVTIVEPFFSSCGRFHAAPEEEHRIPTALAEAMLHLNSSSTQSLYLTTAPTHVRAVHFDRITDALIKDTIANDDLNDALFAFQNHIGIESGDVASIVFCGHWEDEWPTASHARRREMMDHYIEVERSYA